MRKPPRFFPKYFNRACLLLVLLGAACAPSPVERDPAPIDVTQDPVQKTVEKPGIIRVEEGGWTWTITPRASYLLRAVVLSTERYRAGALADLSPWDLAAAWGKLAENDTYRRISWSQASRWYVWTYDSDAGVDNDFIARWSSNTHLIPATPALRRAIPLLNKRRPAELTGFLVAVHGTKGDQWWDWNSSLSRTDTGDGSCEVLYLTRLKIGDRVYE